MFLIIWSGFGILVPVVAILAFFIPACTLQGINPDFANIVGGFASAASLWFFGTFLKNKNHRRHLYFVPMEIWGLIAAAISLNMTCAAIFKLFVG